MLIYFACGINPGVLGIRIFLWILEPERLKSITMMEIDIEGMFNMRYLIWALRLIIFVLVLLFAVKNTAPIAVNLYGDVTLPSVPLVVVLLIAFIAGALYMYLLTLPTRYRQSREVSRLKSEVKHLQSDLTIAANQQRLAQQSLSSSDTSSTSSGYVAIKHD